MAIGKSIINFFKAAAKHNDHIAAKGKMSSQISRHQRVVDGRRKALETANNKLAKANNKLNLADANINSFNTRVRGVQNNLGAINNKIKAQMDIITNPASSKKQIRDAQTDLVKLNQEQQNYAQDLSNLKKSIKTYKNDRKTANKAVKKHTKAQTQASNKFDSATNNYNKYINDMNNYQDPGLGVRTAARIMRDPASLYKEPLRYGAMYGIPVGVGYAYANGSANTDNTLNNHYGASQDSVKLTPDDVYGTEALLTGGADIPNSAAATPAYIPVRNPSSAYPTYAPAPGTIQDVPSNEWAAFAPPGPLVVGNPTEQYSAFAPGPAHLPDVPQDEWDNYAPPQITSPLKEAIRIQLERERQAEATK